MKQQQQFNSETSDQKKLTSFRVLQCFSSYHFLISMYHLDFEQYFSLIINQIRSCQTIKVLIECSSNSRNKNIVPSLSESTLFWTPWCMGILPRSWVVVAATSSSSSKTSSSVVLSCLCILLAKSFFFREIQTTFKFRIVRNVLSTPQIEHPLAKNKTN